MANTEFWVARPTHYWMLPSETIDGTFSFARRYEDAGFDGMLFFDTQNLAPEGLVSLTAAAKETTTLGLGTGVTNPMTRHAAVAASAFSTLQVISNGRAYLGIGRGDSALAHLGYAPTSAGAFEDYLSDLMSYLRGEAVDFAPDADVDRLHLADTPDASRIQWLQNFPRVPVGVAATGPRVISIAARHADRVDLMLGASAKRIQWGMEVAREARRSAGMAGDVPFSAYVNLPPDFLRAAHQCGPALHPVWRRRTGSRACWATAPATASRRDARSPPAAGRVRFSLFHRHVALTD